MNALNSAEDLATKPSPTLLTLPSLVLETIFKDVAKDNENRARALKVCKGFRVNVINNSEFIGELKIRIKKHELELIFSDFHLLYDDVDFGFGNYRKGTFYRQCFKNGDAFKIALLDLSTILAAPNCKLDTFTIETESYAGYTQTIKNDLDKKREDFINGLLDILRLRASPLPMTSFTLIGSLAYELLPLSNLLNLSKLKNFIFVEERRVAEKSTDMDLYYNLNFVNYPTDYYQMKLTKTVANFEDCIDNLLMHEKFVVHLNFERPSSNIKYLRDRFLELKNVKAFEIFNGRNDRMYFNASNLAKALKFDPKCRNSGKASKLHGVYYIKHYYLPGTSEDVSIELRRDRIIGCKNEVITLD